MEDPMAGWAVLSEILKPAGLMKIGLYSRTARSHVTRLREKYSHRYKTVSDTEILAFRHNVELKNDPDYAKLTEWGDFYTMSSLRDYIFHVQEHQFGIVELINSLRKLNLEFCGFTFDDISIKHSFGVRFPSVGDQLDLAKWELFEKENPFTFSAMYQFWCQKKIT
jgi:hypothetical protein